jgi:hypothetical protein
LFVVVITFVDIRRARKEVGFAMETSGSVSEDYVILHQLRDPVSLSTREILGLAIIFEVSVIGNDVDWFLSAKEIFPPFRETVHDCE